MRGLWMPIFVVTLCMGLWACSQSQPSFFLRVDNLDTGEGLLNIPVESGDRFYLDYIHSVSKTPVLDTFQISSKGEIVLMEEDFQWYGSGLEFVNHEGVRIIDSEEGNSEVLLKRHFPCLLLRVGWVGKQRLTINDKVIPLLDIANGGELLKILVAKDGG